MPIVLTEEDATALANPPAGTSALLVDDSTHEYATKAPDGTVSPLTGTPGADAPLITSFDAGNSGAAYEHDLADGVVQELVLNSATPDITFTGWPSAPDVGLLQAWYTQDGTGNRVPTFGAEVDWGSAGEPDWSTASGQTDIVNFETRDGGTRVLASLQGRPGAAGAAGTDGLAGGAISIPYVFSTTTTDSDPGSGNLRLSNATQASATVIRADLLDSGGTDWTAVLDTLDDATGTVKGHIRLFKSDDATKWLVFTVSALATPSGYRNVTVANVGSSTTSPFANGDPITLAFSRAGDVGASGTASVGSDPIWDAAGDIAQGTGADTAARLAIGTAYQAPRVNAGATALEYAGAMTLFAAIDTSGGAAASIDFTSIPATARSIMIEAVVRGAKAAGFDDFWIRVNNDSGANYDYQLQGAFQTSGAASEGIAQTKWAIGQPAAASATAGLFSYFRIFLPFYANTVHRKTGYAESSEITGEGSGGMVVRHAELHWRAATAISRVTLLFAGGNVAQDSYATLYLVS